MPRKIPIKVKAGAGYYFEKRLMKSCPPTPPSWPAMPCPALPCPQENSINSALECEQAADAIAKGAYKGTQSWSEVRHGCYLNANDKKIYYNEDGKPDERWSWSLCSGKKTTTGSVTSQLLLLTIDNHYDLVSSLLTIDN